MALKTNHKSYVAVECEFWIKLFFAVKHYLVAFRLVVYLHNIHTSTQQVFVKNVLVNGHIEKKARKGKWPKC